MEMLRLGKSRREEYFRMDERVVVDGQDLSEILIGHGLAVRYDGGTETKDWCAETGGDAAGLFGGGGR